MRVEYLHSEPTQAFEASLTEIEYEAFEKCLRYIGEHPNPDRIRTFYYRSLDAIVHFAYRDTQFVIAYQWMQRTTPSDPLLKIELINAIHTSDTIYAFQPLQNPL